MTTNNLINNTKKYIAGIHQFVTVGTGSTSVAIPDIISQSDINTMTIQNGNIGIGTTYPTSALHVVGNIMTMGNIGIGTANPTSDLHIVGNMLITGTVIASNVSVLNNFSTTTTITSNQMIIVNAGTGPALKVTQTGDNSVAEFYDNESGIALYVGNQGNIGIGTSTPRAVLDINSTSGIILPSGTTSTRPSQSNTGMLRYNTTNNRLEITNGLEWSTFKHFMKDDDVLGVYTTNRILHLDAGYSNSYPGNGNIWYDLSGCNINATGTNVGFSRYPPEYFAFNVDANNAYFDLTLTNPAGAWVHSISFWMMLTVPQSSLSSRVNPFQIGSTATTSAYSAVDISSASQSWYFFSNDTSFTYTFIQWQWYHLVLTYNGGAANATNKQLYINNTLVTLTGTSTSPLNISANAVMSIGRDRTRNSAYFPGRIAQFMIYNQVLDANAVAQNFNAHRTRYGR